MLALVCFTIHMWNQTNIFHSMPSNKANETMRERKKPQKWCPKTEASVKSNERARNDQKKKKTLQDHNNNL